MTVNGEQFEIVRGGARVVVCEVGATLRAYEVEGVPFVETFPAQVPPPFASGAVLAPWPNRVESGRWIWNGQAQQLALTEPQRGNAIHGLVRYATWRVTERSASVVTLETRVNVQPGWPVPVVVSMRYALGEGGLTVTHGVRNIGEVPVPCGVGAHCYPRAGSSLTDESTLRLAASSVLHLDDERKLPIGAPKPVDGDPYDFREGRLLAGVRLDTAFGGCVPTLDDVQELVRHSLAGPKAKIEMWADRSFGWVQVCTNDTFPGRGRTVAIEPMTCPPNALRSGIDLIWLGPAQSWTGSWGLRPSPFD